MAESYIFTISETSEKLVEKYRPIFYNAITHKSKAKHNEMLEYLQIVTLETSLFGHNTHLGAHTTPLSCKNVCTNHPENQTLPHQRGVSAPLLI